MSAFPRGVLDLPPVAGLALLARVLHRAGYDDDITGHISMRAEEDTLLFTPRLFRWDEVTANDVVRVDRAGNVVEGRWSATIVAAMHFAIYDARPDVAVVVHGHPRYATLWSAVPCVPPPYDQSSAMGLADEEIGLLHQYEHVEDPAHARATAAALGAHAVLLLANHGVIVAGSDLVSAHGRAATFEHRCHVAWEHRAAGAAQPLPDRARRLLGTTNPYADGSRFAAMARLELTADPTVDRAPLIARAPENDRTGCDDAAD